MRWLAPEASELVFILNSTRLLPSNNLDEVVQAMLAVRRYLRKTRMSPKELLQAFIILIVMLLVVIFGMYLGIWLLHQEEAQEPASRTTKIAPARRDRLP